MKVFCKETKGNLKEGALVKVHKVKPTVDGIFYLIIEKTKSGYTKTWYPKSDFKDWHPND
jgi:hypothetical protein